MTDRGTLFVFSGPSGTGKGTILAGYFDKYNDSKLKYSDLPPPEIRALVRLMV